MPAPRQNVVSAFVFLVAIMILTNLILLAVYVGWNLNDERQITFPPPEADAQTIPAWRHGVNSIRFVRYQNKRVVLYTPKALVDEEIAAIAHRIEYYLNQKGLQHRKIVQGYIRFEGRLKRTLQPSALEIPIQDVDPGQIWSSISNWPIRPVSNLGQVLRVANHAKITQALNSHRGTQLKIELILDGGQRAIFKPQWYTTEYVVNGDIYGGKDRHFGEIAAFYLSQLLGYSSAPIAVGRKIDLKKEIIPWATEELGETFFYNGSNMCFYGVCFYCRREEPACGSGNVMEGALILILNQKFHLTPNPWRRSYKKDVFAPWELNKSFCRDLVVKGMGSEEQREFLLDLVAVSVFDFLIGNGDRHHLEVYDDPFQKPGHSQSILLIDNGKSFGNPREDYFDILAPLFQCCKIRSSLWSTLRKFRGRLGKSLDSVTTYDPLYPLLPPQHLMALEERLEIVYATVQFCLEGRTKSEVIM